MEGGAYAMTTWFKRAPEDEARFAEERVVLAATEMVHEALDDAGITKRELAARLGVRPSEVSQRLNGGRNLTLRSLARMMFALGSGVRMEAADFPDPARDAPEIGTRVTRRVAKSEPDTAQRIWRLGVKVVVRDDDHAVDQNMALHIGEVVEAAKVLGHIDSVDMATGDDGDVLIHLGVVAEDFFEAVQIGTAALRTAIHTSGGSTPGWEKDLKKQVSALKINIDLPLDADETTACG